jgi:hypothetical protein
VAPDPRQKMPTAEINDHTKRSFEYPYLQTAVMKVICMLRQNQKIKYSV